jgi:rhamnulokinase
MRGFPLPSCGERQCFAERCFWVKAVHAAVDLGASSARLFAGQLDNQRLVVREVKRVPNRPVRLPDGLHWDLIGIYGEMLDGLAALSREAGSELWVGVDGWGVDYGLLDAQGRLLGLPYHYRDARTQGLGEKVAALLGPGELYRATGVQEMEINTVFQLLAEAGGAAYKLAATLLLVPDLIGYFLTGERRFERTNASTTQLVDARTGRISDRAVDSLGLRRELFAPPIGPGEVLGPVLPEVAAGAGIQERATVVAVASHDTASAVLAVPARSADFAYVASGTWSLVGLELEAPVITEESRRANFSNELGVDGTVRFLRNTMGHWVLQECERAWAAEGRGQPVAELVARAAGEEAFRSVVDLSAQIFAKPGLDMASRVRSECAATGEPVPGSDEALVRCIVDSMALAAAETLEEAARLASRDVGVVHVVGGGSANQLYLDDLAAATGLPVVAGPVEASAIGNLLMSLRASGQAGDRGQMRAIVASSFPTKRVLADVALARKAQEARRRLRSCLSEVGRCR